MAYGQNAYSCDPLMLSEHLHYIMELNLPKTASTNIFPDFKNHWNI